MESDGQTGTSQHQPQKCSASWHWVDLVPFNGGSEMKDLDHEDPKPERNMRARLSSDAKGAIMPKNMSSPDLVQHITIFTAFTTPPNAGLSVKFNETRNMTSGSTFKKRRQAP